MAGGDADYGTDADWHLNNGTDCNTATGTSCQVTLPANHRDVTATVVFNADNVPEVLETFTVSIQIASVDLEDVVLGNSSSLGFTIEYPNGTVGIGWGPDAVEVISGVFGTEEEGNPQGPPRMDQPVLGLELVVRDPAGLAALLGGDITLTTDIVSKNEGTDGSAARVDARIDAPPVIDGNTGMLKEFRVFVISDGVFEGRETVVITLTDDNNVLPPGWTIDPGNNNIVITIPANNAPS